MILSFVAGIQCNCILITFCIMIPSGSMYGRFGFSFGPLMAHFKLGPAMAYRRVPSPQYRQ